MSLAQGNNTPTRPRIEPGSPDPESDALTTRPVRPLLLMVGWVPYTCSIIGTVNSLSETTFATNLGVDDAFILWGVFVVIQLNSLCDALIYALRLEVVQQGYKAVFRKICKNVECISKKSPQHGCDKNDNM